MKRLLVSLMFVLVGIAVANEFVIEPSKKKSSASNLKETIAHKQVEIIERCACAQELLAQVQKKIIHDTRSLLEQDKKTIFASKKNTKLELYDGLLDELLSEIDSTVQMCHAHLNEHKIVVA